jgi:hypothetical protein
MGMAYLLSSLPSEAACTPHPHLPLLLAPSCAASLLPLALEVAPARLFIRCLCPHTEPWPPSPTRRAVSKPVCGAAGWLRAARVQVPCMTVIRSPMDRLVSFFYWVTSVGYQVPPLERPTVLQVLYLGPSRGAVWAL